MSKIESPEVIYWKPSPKDLSQSALGQWCQDLGYKNYQELHRWSVTKHLDFWQAWLLKSGIIFEGEGSPVFRAPIAGTFYGGSWFPKLRLNFAENLLQNLTELPIVHWLENGESVRWTKTDVLSAVSLMQQEFKKRGLKEGEVVAAIAPHRPQTLFAMLAATSLGLIWTSCSPDFGVQGIFDRFSQVGAKLLLGFDGTEYNGKYFDLREKNKTVCEKLQLESEFLNLSTFDWKSPNADKIEFKRLPFSHPLYILYSSGTTGAPKCLIHSAGGTLLQHLKELKLHCDLRPDEKIFYYTTCGWMMWNWVVSALGCGAQLHTYEGSPSYPQTEALWERVAKEKINVFGTSAKYISSCRIQGMKNIHLKLGKDLRLTLSTGSVLLPEDFDYFYTEINPTKDIPLASISGGTDIVSCFILGSPLTSIRRGEISCLGLGMDVKCLNENGKEVFNEEGELVCAKPFPSMPIGFVSDPENKKYQAAYFDRFPGYWHHGDYMMLSKDGSVTMKGRSDATLNPGGVRIGTAELYRQVETLPEIKDSLVIGHEKNGDEKIYLFVLLKEGNELTEELKALLKKKIREGASPRHVPDKIFRVSEIPYTLSGKKVEIAVKHIFAGREPKNIEALSNPQSLDIYRKLRDEVSLVA